MTKITTFIAGAVMTALGLGAAASMPEDTKLTAKWKDTSFYSLKSTSLAGEPADLAAYEGKVTLVVNVASQCGMTPQYAGLEKLYRELKDKDFVIVGFPCNDFGGQEPGTSEEIKTFCSTKYDVTFPLMAKLQTKAGEGQSEIYEYLGTRTGKLPGWNFAKYLVGRDGQTITFFDSRVKPDAKELREAIDKALATKAPPKSPKESPAESPAAPKADKNDPKTDAPKQSR
jgi:glutathione peroxidase